MFKIEFLGEKTSISWLLVVFFLKIASCLRKLCFDTCSKNHGIFFKDRQKMLWSLDSGINYFGNRLDKLKSRIAREWRHQVMHQCVKLGIWSWNYRFSDKHRKFEILDSLKPDEKLRELRMAERQMFSNVLKHLRSDRYESYHHMTHDSWLIRNSIYLYDTVCNLELSRLI